MPEAKKPSGTAMPFDFAQFGDMGAGTWESMSEASRKLLEASATMNKEIFEFVGSRLNQDMAAQQKLMSATSFEDIQRIYAEFFQNASRQYMDEMQKLFSMATGSMSDAAQTVAKAGDKSR